MCKGTQYVHADILCEVETVKLTFEKLGISKNTDSFLMELEAKVEETSMLRYPYTLFHSTMPDKTAHMYGKIRIKK